MRIEIVEQPIRFHLYGIEGTVEDERFGEVGFRLMNEMWRLVKGAAIATTGINHWVYLPDKKMFVGVELRNPQQPMVPQRLEPLDLELQRYMHPKYLEFVKPKLSPPPGGWPDGW